MNALVSDVEQTHPGGVFKYYRELSSYCVQLVGSHSLESDTLISFAYRNGFSTLYLGVTNRILIASWDFFKPTYKCVRRRAVLKTGHRLLVRIMCIY
jgi:hypothetical protein